MNTTYGLLKKDNRDWITAKFGWNAAWNKKMDQVAGAKCSSSLKCWLVLLQTRCMWIDSPFDYLFNKGDK